MSDLNQYFEILISEDYMYASIQLKEEYDPAEIDEAMIDQWLKREKILFGIDRSVVKQLATGTNFNMFPVRIATGIDTIDGQDGTIDFVCDQEGFFDEGEKRNFRDVKKIPALNEDELIARITLPTKGITGENILGKKMPARNGKPIKLKAGKNVRFDSEKNAFFSTTIGKLSVDRSKINVFNTYELNEDLSMLTGNIKFAGSVLVRGNVPDGFSVQADGDIFIYGLVEAGHLEAGGNVEVSEGIVGLQKGSIKAGGDVNIGYVNQAKIEAEQNINVRNTIMHSHCVAKGRIICQNGQIIGGTNSAGQSIEAKDVGNRMDTKTEVAIGVNQQKATMENKLFEAKFTLKQELEKLELIGKRLQEKAKQSELSAKEKILLLKQRNSQQVTEDKLTRIENQLERLNVQIGDENKARLIVKGSLYPNVDLRFGKYQRTTEQCYKYSQAFIEDGEIRIVSL
ncbi:hypothetical protein SAMN04488134_101401 [Amphibacillus marinus]|uniref:Flagellar Assembly Protein A N-terminal region domain-containing protein n=1 Tax=Amphibacillus marinus TaxID=872970 RepID=A0A1H8HQ52_9BACI|nr:FapA family protein [Amphibacillus marinus]SEN57838.1 hypothetical protein SAMN04488134_101401 [Amphibacillus marinus]